MARIEDCQDCGACRDRCPYDLDPPALLAKMHEDYKQFAAEHAEALGRRYASELARRRNREEAYERL